MFQKQKIVAVYIKPSSLAKGERNPAWLAKMISNIQRCFDTENGLSKISNKLNQSCLNFQCESLNVEPQTFAKR